MRSDNLGILEIIQRSNYRLSIRDIRILQMTADSYYEKDIADILHLSHRTIKKSKGRIYNEIGAECAAHAVAIAFRKGLIE